MDNDIPADTLILMILPLIIVAFMLGIELGQSAMQARLDACGQLTWDLMNALRHALGG